MCKKSLLHKWWEYAATKRDREVILKNNITILPYNIRL
jgi:hypothetical protein